MRWRRLFAWETRTCPFEAIVTVEVIPSRGGTLAPHYRLYIQLHEGGTLLQFDYRDRPDALATARLMQDALK